MRVLKILGMVFGTLLLVTGFVLAGGWQAANVAKAETAEEWANSGYAGPVDATVQSVDQASPVIVTVTYTDTQGNTHTAKGEAINDKPPEVGATVPTYYTTSDPDHVIVDNLLPASIWPGPTYLPGLPQQPPARYPAQLYPPQQPPDQPHPPQQYPPQR